jgi:predicted protein tyrosine phosphatase
VLEVFVGSESLIETLTFNKPYIQISIRSYYRGEIKAELPDDPNRKGLLFIQFDDCTERERHVAKPITKQEARRIWGFIEQHKPEILDGSIELLVVNCEAGVSRSPAVAAAILESFQLPQDYCYHPRFKQNFYVRRVMRSTHPDCMGEQDRQKRV